MAVVTDNFNRANGAVGANWTQPPVSGATLNVISNKCGVSATSTFCAGFWNASTFANDQYSQVTIGTASTSSGEANGLICRAKSGTDEFYMLFVTSTQLQFYIRTGGSFVNPNSATFTVVSGDVVKWEVLGNTSPVTINAYVNGALKLTATTTTVINGGSPGIIIYDTGHSLSVDDWESVDTSVVTVTVNLTGVAATPAVGTGTFNIGSAVVTPPEAVLVAGGRRLYWLEDEEVSLTGVAADPQVGEITPVAKLTPDELARRFPFPRRQVAEEVQMPHGMRGLFKKVVPPEVFVYQVGSPKLRSAVGDGKVIAHFEDIDEELMALVGVL